MGAQVAGNEPPTDAPANASPASRFKTRRFRNWKMVAIELAVVLLGFYVLNAMTVRKSEIPGVAGVLVGIGALWFLHELSGISIDSETMSLPTNRIPWMPVLSFWRRSILLSDLR